MKQSVTITGENLNVVVNNSNEQSVSSNGAKIMSKAEKRIAALKAKGIDVSCYFPLGVDQVVKIENGNAIPVDMTDDVEKKMVEGGYINHYSLFRRWVMAQMFYMLREMDKSNMNFTYLLQRKGYEYSWKMLEHELYAQSKMYKHGDIENFRMRNSWFNSYVAVSMAEDYLDALKKYIEKELIFKKTAWGGLSNKYKHTCKGNPYIRFCGQNIFVEDIDRKIFSPIRAMIEEMRADYGEWNINRLYNAVCAFNKLRKKMKWGVKISKSFIDAYKGSGAYFTMRNLIMFHGAKFVKSQGVFMSQAESLDYLEECACKNVESGWVLLGVLKGLIKNSDISIQEKIDEWGK